MVIDKIDGRGKARDKMSSYANLNLYRFLIFIISFMEKLLRRESMRSLFYFYRLMYMYVARTHARTFCTDVSV